MPTLTESAIGTLLTPYLTPPPEILPQHSLYHDLQHKWNARTNQTAIPDPEAIVRPHYGESHITATHLPPAETLLDFGSGAGFPGLPIQLLLPNLQVTLAESQNKKATFLREAVRTLGLKTEVWAARVETMPETRTFDIVTLRAVDDMSAALTGAGPRIHPGGTLAVLTSGTDGIPIPNTQSSILKLTQY